MALPEEFLNQYRQQTGNRQPHSPIGASALSIAWSLCSGGIWARNVSIGRRAVVTEKGGKRSYPQVRLTDPEQSVHARDTWQHTDRYRTVTDPYPHVIQEKPSFGRTLDARTRAQPTWQC